MKTNTVRDLVPFISHPSSAANRGACRSLAAPALRCCALWLIGFSLLLTALPARAVSDGTVVAWGNNGSGQTTLPGELTGVTAIAGGGNHTVALKSDGTVVAWGLNDYGQTTLPAGLTGVTAIAAGDIHTVALRSDGTVVAWGYNNHGQTTVPAGLTGVTAIAAALWHTVALTSDGTVVAWGYNGHGETTVPAGLTGVTAIAAGYDHMVALKSDGTVVAWGSNFYGQTTVPAGLTGVSAITAGGYHTVALKSDGTVVAWGYNNHGQATVPAGLTGVTAIAAGGWHTVALKSDGTVVAWGRNNFSQTTVPAGLTGVTAIAAGDGHTVAIQNVNTATAWGNNTYGQTTVPGSLTGVTAVAGGGNHTVALKSDGTVAAWGWNNYGQTTPPAGLAGVTAIAAGDEHTVALKSDGTVVTWGSNNYGVGTLPAGLTGVTAIAAGLNHTVALKSDGTVVAWGYPATVPAGLTGVTAIAAGYDHMVALKSDGTVVAWGSNQYGQTAVPAGLTGVTAITAGGYHTVALKSDGTAAAWGYNNFGQATVPAGLTGATAISAGGWHTVALKSGGTVVAWGRNNVSQTTVPAGLSGVTAIAAGDGHTVALIPLGDQIAPTLTPVTIASSNANAAFAKTGDVVTLSFAASEPIQTPVVTLAGKSATVTNPSGNDWSATITVAADDPQGVAAFSIAFKDLADNDGVPVTATTDASSVTIDHEAPVLTLPSNQTAEATGAGGATVNYPAATATDNFTASPTIGYSQASDTLFPLGTTTVTVTATDEAGNPGTSTFDVTVLDTTAPVAEAPAGGFTPISLTVAPAGTAAMPDYRSQLVASDLVGVTGVTQTPPPGTAFSPGLVAVSLVARDAADNASVAVTFDVTFNASDGTLDADFNPNADSYILSTAVQPDGKMVIGGVFSTVGGSAHNLIARLNADGTLDTTFNPILGGNQVHSITVQANGKILIAGYFATVDGAARGGFARLNGDGTLDTAFDPNPNGWISCIVVQPDGKIVIVGHFSTVGGEGHSQIARLNPDGTPDTGFNPTANDNVYSAALQVDGKIVIGGAFNSVNGESYSGVARLNADGTLDTSFSHSGTGPVYITALQADGKIVISGSFDTIGGATRNQIARLNADGTVDTGFDPNLDTAAVSTVVQADGKIVIGGYFTTVGGTARPYVARLNANGSLDTSFEPDVDGLVYSTELLANGALLLGGPFTTVDGTPRNRIARLLNGPATQTLTVPNAARVEWQRGGTAPETTQVSFELSTDGTTWTSLGTGARITGGWELTGLSLPANGTIRARARTMGGYRTGCSGLVEQQASFSDLPPVFPEIAVEQPVGTDLIDGTASIGCGSVMAGASGAAQTFTIFNRGATTLTGLAITQDGPHSGEFSVDGPAVTSLAAGANTTFSVTFTPAAYGTRSAALHIASNDADENPFDISLSGTGLTALEAWRLENFGTTSNTGEMANTADQDHDGVSNLMEYAFGLDPEAPSTQLVPQWQQIGNDLTCTFTRPPGVTGIIYGAEWSPTMAPGSWLPLINTAADPEYTYTVPIESTGQKFVRLKASLFDDNGHHVEYSGPWNFEFAGGVPVKLVWQSEIGKIYDLLVSDDLTTWTQAAGFPMTATGETMEYTLVPGVLRFYKIIPSSGEFSLIPAGTFQMGDDFGESYSFELPVHDVSVSAFYMAKHEVTKALWDEVRMWGAANGYTDLTAGTAKAANHPVERINWHEMVKWCNARSEKDGLTPCYTVSGAVYRTGSIAPVCDWSANGYRLPTEAEWERAARGGLSGKRYPWGDTISHNEANYKSSGTAYGNLSGDAGFHPAYATGSEPYTSPVGSFPANAYGLHDMAGNQWEWCWDWWSESYYTSSPASDPRGPASGTGRAIKGGGAWDFPAIGCRVAFRNNGNPNGWINCIGFRLARSSVPEGFSLIPAGSFQMGDAFAEGASSELPVHTVNVGAFYMAKYEVTKDLWDEVKTWGATHGYTDLPAGGGKAADHPVHSINWYAMVKWCNARSEKDGLTPCYTVSGAVYRTGSSAPDCNWSANGYRMPTEAEWEKAARGGLSGKRFPWGDVINHSYANYYNSSYSYESPQNQGYHPTYATGGYPDFRC